MRTLSVLGILLLVATIPSIGANSLLLDTGILVEANIVSILNFIVLITSCISIFHFISPPDQNKTAFHLFNIIFVVVFYWIAFRFLLSHKEYYEGYEKLSDTEAIKKYLIPDNFFEWLKKIIVVAFVFNIIYVLRNGREYFSNL